MDEVVHFMTSPAALLAVEITELADHMLAREVDSLTASGSGILEKSRPVRTEEPGGQSSLEADLWRSGRSRKARGVLGSSGVRAHGTTKTCSCCCR